MTILKITAKNEINRIDAIIDSGTPFTFVRFSDGEVEILRNRKLIIQNGKTEFRGRIFKNNFPDFDNKTFEPARSVRIRSDLLESALFNEINYLKGIRTYNSTDPNSVIDREFLLRLHGGFDEFITFCDILVNENYMHARNVTIPKLLKCYKKLYLVCNWRSVPKNILSHGQKLNVPDNFFLVYDDVILNLMSRLGSIEEGSLVLSSASSLSNIVGYKLRISRPDITFVDIGTALNDCLGLPSNTREYHNIISSKEKFGFFKMIRMKQIKRSLRLKW